MPEGTSVERLEALAVRTNFKEVPLFKINRSLRSTLFMGVAALATLGGTSDARAGDEVEVVVVTGSMIKGNANLVSPITVIDTAQLDRSGISTIQGALQQSNLNSGPAITNGWTANGNFAQGASGASLRGLTTNSTLVLFDGLRAAYYPLADDGVRNFVDLNTIPDDIVDRVQVLRDGASSSYGADAIAGVINIITRREFQGLSGRAEGGISGSGDGASMKLSMIGGVGDLRSDRVNFYLSGYYYHSDKLNAADRPYPFNSYDWSHVCYRGICGANGVQNGIEPDGSFGGVTTGANFLVRPYDLNGTGDQITTPVPGSRWQNLNTDCGPGTSATLTPAQQGATAPSTVCQYDYRKLYGVINPAITRFGLSGHAAFELPNGIQGWAQANFMQDQVSYPSNPPAFYANGPTGIYYPRFSTAVNYAGTSPPAPGSLQLFLPVWVCPERTNCSTAVDRMLNPNNPFAGSGFGARLIGRDVTRRTFESTRDRSYRVAGGLSGTAFGDVDWTVSATAMHTDLYRLARNFAYIQHLLDVIKDGSYNFLNPSLNSKALNDYLYPDNISNASSDEAQLQATAQKPLWRLWGGI
jgi:iron complex outermembrane receptor protein